MDIQLFTRSVLISTLGGKLVLTISQALLSFMRPYVLILIRI